MDKKRSSVTRLLILLSVLFLLTAGAGLYLGSRFISDKLMRSGEAMGTDLALLVKNNFEITDEEAAYMKSLTFNEMEVDPINKRLMDVSSGVALNAAVRNVYLLAPLSPAEYRYCPDDETAEFLGFSTDTPLDGIWLLNGRINSAGEFEAAAREDIFRYTALDENQRRGMEHKEAFGTFSSDAWGTFITGYAPIYTVEGSFVGLLGIDMDPDPYQNSAQHMILIIIVLFAVIMVMFSALSIVFFLKYAKDEELKRQFAFFSDMSHEMRTPLNGILGMAALSRDETDVAVLHQNFESIENSGNQLLMLINGTLDYKEEVPASPESPKSRISYPISDLPVLQGKNILLCEDHPINAEIMRRLLEKAGCSVEVAENGQVGLDMFGQSPPGYFDAILMDVRMPVMDGIEATEKIRSQKRRDAKKIPIIAVTANSYEEDMKKTAAAGMNAHLTKPISPEILYKILTALLKPDGRR